VWLLLTDTIPTQEQAESLTAELHKRAGLGPGVEALIRSLPKDMHPMTQLVMGLMAEQVGLHHMGLVTAVFNWSYVFHSH
jgi:citrate synthase